MNNREEFTTAIAYKHLGLASIVYIFMLSLIISIILTPTIRVVAMWAYTTFITQQGWLHYFTAIKYWQTVSFIVVLNFLASVVQMFVPKFR